MPPAVFAFSWSKFLMSRDDEMKKPDVNELQDLCRRESKFQRPCFRNRKRVDLKPKERGVAVGACIAWIDPLHCLGCSLPVLLPRLQLVGDSQTTNSRQD